jgi:lipopolysaccharide export system permease protein
MLNRIDRYCFWQTLSFSGGVAFVILAIQSFVTLVAEASDLAAIGWLSALEWLFLQLPQALLLLLPVIVLLGGLTGLGVLASNAELVAMRAAGLSPLRLSRGVLAAAALLAVFGFLITETVLPPAQQRAEVLMKGQANVQALWLKDESSIVHAESVPNERRLQGVEIFHLDAKNRLIRSEKAAFAEYKDGRWQLFSVESSQLNADKVLFSKQASAPWQTTLSANLLKLFILERDQITLRGLRRLTVYLEQNGLDASRYRLDFAVKCVQPFSVMVMALVVLPFVLGSLRSVSLGQRLMVGIGVGLLYFTLNRVFSSLGLLYSLPVWVAASLPTVLILLFALWRLRRA